MKTSILSKLNLKLSVQILFGLFAFLFWQFGFPYTLFFQEQLQLFQTTIDYFIESLIIPGGFIGYLGEFFTQFYLFPVAGPFIITAFLLLLRGITAKILYKVDTTDRYWLLSYLPAVLCLMVLSEELYLLSGLIGIILSLASLLFYISVKSHKIRIVTAFSILPVIYFLTGGSFILFMLGVIVFENLSRKKGVYDGLQRMNFVTQIIFIAFALLLPIAGKYTFNAVPLPQAYITEFYHKISTVIPFPVLLIWIFTPLMVLFVNKSASGKKKLPQWANVSWQIILLVVTGIWGYRSFTNSSAELVKQYDYYVRRQKWDEVIKLADKKLPRNAFAVNYLNLSLAKTGQLGNRIFQFNQYGVEGFFLNYKREFLSALFGNEAFYHLGLVNVSQQYIFESMEASPDHRKTIRSLQRLAETNLINGNYEVTRKYLNYLKKTLFYANWAKNMESYLYDEDRINNHADWGEKRQMKPRQSYFFSYGDLDTILLALIHDNPKNKMAVDYLLSLHLIAKDLDGFLKHMPLAYRAGYETVPTAWQEAVLFVLGMRSLNPEKEAPFPLDPKVVARLKTYAEVYTTYPDAENRLRKNFGNTFWFYLHYK